MLQGSKNRRSLLGKVLDLDSGNDALDGDLDHAAARGGVDRRSLEPLLDFGHLLLGAFQGAHSTKRPDHLVTPRWVEPGAAGTQQGPAVICCTVHSSRVGVESWLEDPGTNLAARPWW